MFLSGSLRKGGPAGATAPGEGAGAGHAPAPAIAAAMMDFPQRIENELPYLRRAVRRWHREKASADDLVQDTLLQALANAHLWQPGSNLRAWLLAIMRNQFLAAIAKSRRSAEMLEGIAGAAGTPSPDPSEPRLLLRDVERALRRLPKTQRTVLLAVAVEDRPQEEVAHMLGISVGAMRCHLARGRDRLRTMMRGDGHPAPFARRPAAAAPAIPRPRPRPAPYVPVLEAAE
jgi:RNA polymerase sigma-70 factor (ECF subfamily)